MEVKDKAGRRMGVVVGDGFVPQDFWGILLQKQFGLGDGNHQRALVVAEPVHPGLDCLALSEFKVLQFQTTTWVIPAGLVRN